MKKFKLIKEYPGCNCKLGNIVEESNDYDRDNNHYKYPEFWEEIIEKDYEILSFKNNGILIEVSLHENDKITLKPHKDPDSLKWLLDNEFKIHSVKRLSDGEVFTVGDEIYSYGTVKSIIKIDIPINNSNDIGFYTTKPEFNGGSGYQYLFKDKVQKVKKPLFTTEDGVDIYEGDNYYNIWLEDFSEALKSYKINGPHSAFDLGKDGYSDRCKYFSNLKTAEEYIIMNKPCLSLNDILNSNSLALQKLKTNVLTMGILYDLVKEKLKL